jgi:hypothetical protein
MRIVFISLTLALLTTPTWAQPVSQRPDPTDPRAAVPATTYRSPLTGYRRLTEPSPPNWRAANDEVERIGGWRAYLREAQRPDSAASAPKDKP